MTTKKIEEKGQRILCDYFAECDRVDTYIPTNDKEPLWDGHLYLYDSAEQKGEQIYGRISTQLKSSTKTTNKDTVKYQVQRTSLETYKRDGGIIYFYVLINNPVSKQIFYCLLTPVVIKKYLRAKSKDGNKVSITLSQLPDDKHQVTEELFQFHSDCKKQTTSAEKPIVEIQDYFSKEGKRQFSVFAKSPDPIKDIFKHIQEHPLYLYATDENQNVTFPIGDGPVTLKIGRYINQVISVDGMPYFKECVVLEDEGETVLLLGNCFTYRSGNQKKNGSLSFRFEGHSNLKKIPYLAFSLAVIKNGKFKVGDVEITCKLSEPPQKFVKDLQSELKVLLNVQELFKAMHIEEDINMDELSESEINGLEALYNGIVLKKPLELKPGAETRVRFKFGNLVLYVVFESDDKGKHYVRDFFMDEDVCALLAQDNFTTKTSRFSLLSVDQFAEASNFDFSLMVANYRFFAEQNEKVAEYANQDMLRMLLAYDKTEGKKTKLLDAAEALNNWFIETERFGDLPINEINRYQILKRRGALSEDVNNRICEILESDVPEDYKAACMLLLDNQTGAEYYFKKLAKNKKEEFKAMPIYKFWK